MIDGDIVQIIVDLNKLEGSIDLVGHAGKMFGAEEGTRILAARPPRPTCCPIRRSPMTRASEQRSNASGGTWGGCVFDVEMIIETLEAGKKALGR
jgi:hypothetical protein